jgi:hypothetical protein
MKKLEPIVISLYHPQNIPIHELSLTIREE